MGFLDKVQDSLNQGQQKLDAVQNKRALEAQLVNLGKWVYATRTGQDGGRGEAEIEIALHQITSMVGQYGMFDLPFATPGAGSGQAQPAPPQQAAPGGFPPPDAQAAPAYEAPAYGAPPSAGGAPPAFDPPPAYGAPPSAGGAPPASVDPSAPGGIVPGAPPQAPHDPARSDDGDDRQLPGGPPPGFGSPPPS
jgi:hypothetical protein